MKKTLSKLALAGAVILLLFLTIRKKNKEYDWLVGTSGPEGYPQEVYRGSLSCKNGEYAWVPNKCSYHGWGEQTGVFVVGNSIRSAPYHLELTWVSYSDKTFYTGSFALNYDTINQLFKDGFIRSDHKTLGTYDNILIGMAPGGTVVVWLTGRGKATEVGCFQGTETIVDKMDFMPSSDPDESMEAYLERKVNWIPSNRSKIWTKETVHEYRRRFMWRPKLVHPNNTGIDDEIQMGFYNGEKDVLSCERLVENKYAMTARVKFLDFLWSNQNELYQCKINMNEEEILRAYAYIYKDGADKAGELQIRIDHSNNYIRLYMINMDKEYPREIELTKADIKIYPAEQHRRIFNTLN